MVMVCGLSKCGKIGRTWQCSPLMFELAAEFLKFIECRCEPRV